MRSQRNLNQEEGGVLIAILAIIFGAYVRLYPAGIAGFPINDGGLFTVIIQAIKANQLMLPTYIHYNGLNIPFAYPPLAFYISAISSNLFHLSPIDIVHWMPGIISAGTMPAFFYLSKAILNSSYPAGLATLAFAFTPRSFTWSVMGGGLTRSFGLLFLLLSLLWIYRLFKEGKRKYLLPSILFSALVVFSHPEAVVNTIAFAILFWLFVGRDKRGIANALLIALGTIIVTSIWWLPTILRVGLNPILSAAQTGGQSTVSIFFPFLLTLTEEPFLTFVAILGFIGFFVCLVHKDYLLPICYFVPFLVDPRSGATYSMIPLSMMAGLALSGGILPAFTRLNANNKPTGQYNPFQSSLAITFLVFSAVYMLGGTIFFDTQIAGNILSEQNRTAFDWIKTTTPPESRFLIMTGEEQFFCDTVQEWFPVLTDRVSVTTIQGNEWMPNNAYAHAVTLQSGIQSCLYGSTPLSCINRYQLQFEYIYINRQGTLKNYCRVVAPFTRGDNLIIALKNNIQYQLAYQSNAVTIFSILH